jgi:hypothetical protein
MAERRPNVQSMFGAESPHAAERPRETGEESVRLAGEPGTGPARAQGAITAGLHICYCDCGLGEWGGRHMGSVAFTATPSIQPQVHTRAHFWLRGSVRELRRRNGLPPLLPPLLPLLPPLLPLLPELELGVRSESNSEAQPLAGATGVSGDAPPTGVAASGEASPPAARPRAAAIAAASGVSP